MALRGLLGRGVTMGFEGSFEIDAWKLCCWPKINQKSQSEQRSFLFPLLWFLGVEVSMVVSAKINGQNLFNLELVLEFLTAVFSWGFAQPSFPRREVGPLGLALICHPPPCIC